MIDRDSPVRDDLPIHCTGAFAFIEFHGGIINSSGIDMSRNNNYFPLDESDSLSAVGIVTFERTMRERRCARLGNSTFFPDSNGEHKSVSSEILISRSPIEIVNKITEARKLGRLALCQSP